MPYVIVWSPHPHDLPTDAILPGPDGRCPGLLFLAQAGWCRNQKPCWRASTRLATFYPTAAAAEMDCPVSRHCAVCRLALTATEVFANARR